MRTWNSPDVTNIARPESVVLLAATVRAAREMVRRERIDGLKERVSDGGYAISSKDLAQRVLATKV
jgi:anti-sigma28 factor (negative regulator of flagellin synthesis)